MPNFVCAHIIIAWPYMTLKLHYGSVKGKKTVGACEDIVLVGAKFDKWEDKTSRYMTKTCFHCCFV